MIGFKAKKVSLLAIILGLFLITALCFCACEQNYSASGIENNLKNAGYTVSEGESFKFSDGTDVTTFAGFKFVYLVTKGTAEDKECGLIIVFDSIGNADKLSDEQLLELREAAKNNCGSSKSESLNIATGRFNNVVFAGYKDIQTAAKLS